MRENENIQERGYVVADKYDLDGMPDTNGKHLDPRKWENAGQFNQDEYYDGDEE